MTLIWKHNNYEDMIITEENASSYQYAVTDFGLFRLNISARRQYKDGTREYRTRLLIQGSPYAEATLLRTRGNLLDAIQATEKKLFKYYHLPRLYRLPVECIDADPSTQKLLQRHVMCFECDSETCALNPDGVCMYPVLHGVTPEYDDHDGCKGFLFKE